MTPALVVCKCESTTFTIEWDGTYWIAICSCGERNYLTHTDDEEEERLDKEGK